MHPIYALWCHPRSMSTATERIMRERGDLDCLHEPFLLDYYVARQVRRLDYLDVPQDAPRDYAAIRDMILARAENGPVFLKDMAYYVVPRVFDDGEFAARLTHAFLIRDPRASIVSYWKLTPEILREEIGIEAQWRLFHWVREMTGATPPLIRAEDVRGDPEGAIGRLWDRLGLSSAPHAFEWGDETPEDWKHVEGWHGSVLKSGGIRPPSGDDPAERFAKAAAECPRLNDDLAHHLPFYEKLAEHAL